MYNKAMMVLFRRPAALLVLLLGPFMSIFAVNTMSKSLPITEVMFIQFFVILAWSPLFFSIPAYILQDSRDKALPCEKGIVRGIRLMFFLSSKKNEERLLFFISLLTWSILVIVFHSSILYVTSLLIK